MGLRKRLIVLRCLPGDRLAGLPALTNEAVRSIGEALTRSAHKPSHALAAER
jgi:hypothetical protein